MTPFDWTKPYSWLPRFSLASRKYEITPDGGVFQRTKHQITEFERTKILFESSSIKFNYLILGNEFELCTFIFNNSGILTSVLWADGFSPGELGL